jgi:NADH:ubiquinone oxidoreductase subunit 6 (subunit J)
MTLFAAIPNPATGQLILAVVLATTGFFLLLPRPRGRSVAGGIAALLAAAAVFGAWLHESFGKPAPDAVGTVLFYLFAAGAVTFGTVLVVQRNPSRGAIAFAFVILSTCGLFLLLAAPFLMAATIIVYAGAIIVTFLFVLMLSHQQGPSDENDRTREPLLGSLAGFAFAGLVLFALHQQAAATPLASPEPSLVEDREKLERVAAQLAEVQARLDADPRPTNAELAKSFGEIEDELDAVVGVPPGRSDAVLRDGSLAAKLRGRAEKHSQRLPDLQAAAVLDQAEKVKTLSDQTFRKLENASPLVSAANREAAKFALGELRTRVNDLRANIQAIEKLLPGERALPARNVGNVGLVLYSEHLLAVELAGTLLLVATIGAVAIAHRKGVTQ